MILSISHVCRIEKLQKENDVLREHGLIYLSGENAEGTLGYLFQELTKILKANPKHAQSLVVYEHAHILSSIKVIQCFSSTKGHFRDKHCVETTSLSQRSNIVRIFSEKEHNLREHYKMTQDDYASKFVQLDRIKNLSFHEAEDVLRDTNFADPTNRFCFSEKDGWIQEKALIGASISFTAEDLRNFLTPSKKTVMIYHTVHSWYQIREAFSLPKWQLAKMVLEQ